MSVYVNAFINISCIGFTADCVFWFVGSCSSKINFCGCVCTLFMHKFVSVYFKVQGFSCGSYLQCFAY